VNRVRNFKERSLAVKLSHLDDVCFSDRESFRRLVERYIHNRDARDTVAHAQRRFVMDRFTYQAHIKRVTDEIRLRISNERSSS
jgi:spore maturation protein CgeB